MTGSAVSREQIECVLRSLGGWGSIYIPEFTYGDKRIDVLILDTRKRWARGFEIKMSRADFLRDDKWQCYSEFCSSLSIVCPSGLIRKEEIADPFGLLYVESGQISSGVQARWIKRPKRFQRRDGLAWLYQYVRVIEAELPRLNAELKRLRIAYELA